MKIHKEDTSYDTLNLNKNSESFDLGQHKP